MSRRITTKTEMTEKDLAIQALKEAGVEHQVNGDTIMMTSGSLNGCSLNLKTGDLYGDSDYGHTEASMGMLRQYYSEAKVKAECLKTGTVIDERLTDVDGSIILMFHTA